MLSSLTLTGAETATTLCIGALVLVLVFNCLHYFKGSRGECILYAKKGFPCKLCCSNVTNVLFLCVPITALWKQISEVSCMRRNAALLCTLLFFAVKNNRQ